MSKQRLPPPETNVQRTSPLISSRIRRLHERASRGVKRARSSWAWSELLPLHPARSKEKQGGSNAFPPGPHRLKNRPGPPSFEAGVLPRTIFWRTAGLDERLRGLSPQLVDRQSRRGLSVCVLRARFFADAVVTKRKKKRKRRKVRLGALGLVRTPAGNAEGPHERITAVLKARDGLYMDFNSAANVDVIHLRMKGIAGQWVTKLHTLTCRLLLSQMVGSLGPCNSLQHIIPATRGRRTTNKWRYHFTLTTFLHIRCALSQTHIEPCGECGSQAVAQLWLCIDIDSPRHR